jgi:hypothetical protein
MNTFQKYYEQQELQQFIEDVLEATATPVGLGVFYVFRDPADQQDFLSARSRRAIDWNQISARLGLGAPAADRWEGLYAEHQELLSSPAGGSRRSWLARIGWSDMTLPSKPFGFFGSIGCRAGSVRSTPRVNHG